MIEPSLFYPILLLDLWVLGYHHVIATFTRLCFDRASFEERRGLIVHLLPIVAALTILVAWQVGLWVVVTIYFYWQWWHYARQSWGVSRAYRTFFGVVFEKAVDALGKAGVDDYRHLLAPQSAVRLHGESRP